jgi:signal transduction histidine kinase
MRKNPVEIKIEVGQNWLLQIHVIDQGIGIPEEQSSF